MLGRCSSALGQIEIKFRGIDGIFVFFIGRLEGQETESDFVSRGNPSLSRLVLENKMPFTRLSLKSTAPSPTADIQHTPDDVRDAHEAVINGNAEVVHGQSAAPEEDKVAERVCVPGNLSSDGVLDRNILGLLRREANEERL